MGDLIGDGRADEKPEQIISLKNPIAMSKYPITVGSFQTFVATTGYVTEAEMRSDEGCWGIKTDLSIGWLPTENWKTNRLNQDESHPVVCVSWNDAQAYTKWLTAETGFRYRLPTEAEWEFAARGGSEGKYYYGNDATTVCQYINHADYQMIKAWGADTAVSTCDDGYLTTSPVGKFPPNGFGLYDAYGNVWEWVLDCYKPNLEDISADPLDHINAECKERTLRGASWASQPVGITSSYRNKDEASFRTVDYGFRVVRDL
ncbi:hypothetical protein GCM10008090_25780 [Arenicella chitinivorans]|uniref:Sulfatase-modifying factor enzyme-like domain-containing protein n=2 Tax=Arenicella chitinivorans TaxID=1329800 RepID=A0A918RWC0_9GAMM|nr:hypothetical protein GCM10008090_25780 [Arenicella chitinivorans]